MTVRTATPEPTPSEAPPLNRHLVRFSGHGTFAPDVIESASGTTIVTRDGRRLLDFTSGQMSAILGHSHPEIVATVQAQVARLDHLYSGMVSQPVLDLAERICATLPDSLDKVLLLSTGAEANEAAIRMAKLVTGRHEIVSLARSWHGMTQAAVGATYSAGRRGYGPAAPGNFALPVPYAIGGQPDWRQQLAWGFELVDAQSVGSLAACIVEPVLSSGGVIDLPLGYLAALRDECHRRGMLLILDESQTGLCRTGDWYAWQRDDVVPDILVLSKTLGAGLPLSAVIVSTEIEQEAHDRGFLFFTTHVNDPLPAAVGTTVMTVLARDRLELRARELGETLRSGLKELQARHPLIADVRGRGLLLGVEIGGGSGAAAEHVAADVTRSCYERGLHLNIVQVPGTGGTLRIAPPLTTVEAEIDQALQTLDEALTEVQAQTLQFGELQGS